MKRMTELITDDRGYLSNGSIEWTDLEDGSQVKAKVLGPDEDNVANALLNLAALGAEHPVPIQGQIDYCYRPGRGQWWEVGDR